MNKSAFDGATPLYAAVTGAGELSVVQLLVQYGAIVDARSAGGKTALHEAVIRGRTAVVRY